jgi:hypothetical protein
VADLSPQASSIQRCQRCECAIEAGDLRCAVCSLPVPVEQRVIARPAARVLRCETCSAAVAYEVEVQAPRCAFCGSVARVEQPTDPIEQPQWAVPFAVTPEQAREALRRWLGRLGFFRPADLAARASLEGLSPLWWVGWVFDARALISWTADSNAGAHRSAWAPHAGQVPLDFARVLVPASRGLSAEECWQLTPRFDISRASETFSSVGPPGAVCEGFEVQRSAARRMIADAIERLAASQATRFIPGTTYRNLRVAVLLESLRTFRFALPTYVLAYRYRGQLYRALVHGQDAQCVLGTAPWSIARIALVVGGGLALIALAILALALAAAYGSG